MSKIRGKSISLSPQQHVEGSEVDQPQPIDERFRALPEEVRDGCVAFNISGEITEFNSAFQAMIGLSREVLRQLTVEDLTAAHWREPERQVIDQQVMVRGYSDVYEKELVRQDGTLLPVELRTYLVRDENGGPLGMWAIVRDISVRKNAERELQRVNSDLRQIFNASVPSCVVAKDFTVLRVNDTYCSRFRLKRQDLIGRKCYDLWPSPFCHDSSCPLEKILGGEKHYEFEWEEVLPDGVTASFNVTVVPYCGTDGETLGMIENYTDITERKRAEDELRQSQQMLRLIMDNIPQSIFWKDRNSVYLGCNPEFVNGTGVASPGDVIGKTDFEMPWSDSAEAFRRDDRAVMETGVPKLNYEELEASANGEEIWLRTSKVPLRDASGDVVAVLGMSENITERKHLAEQLRQAQKMEAVGQLAGGIAHDFNNLLGGIMGFAELLQAGVSGNNELAGFAREILDTSQRAADLVAQLLAFSRQGKTNSVPVDIHSAIDKVVRLLEHTIDRRIQIKRRFEATPAETIGDPTQLQNAILNLAVNARDAMPDGGSLTFATCIVELDGEFSRKHDLQTKHGEYIELSVTDTGTGMEEKILAQIFEPFFTTKVVGKGTGLGLAAVYGIAREHSGAITVESELSKGSTFRLYLPVATTESERLPKSTESASTRSIANILVVDDEAIIRRMARTVLMDLGYQVVTAQNGREAVQIYEKHGDEIDLVILDMIMPVMNGQEALLRLREIDPEVRVLASSGFSHTTGAGSTPVDELAGFVQKPYRRRQLARKVAEVLGTSESQGDPKASDSNSH